MKKKYIVYLPLLLALSGCSISTQSTAKELVVSGCEEFRTGYKSNDYIMPSAAKSHFAKAARLDPGYIPLAQAAQVLSSSFETVFIGVDSKESWHNANNLLWGVCAE